MVSRAERSAFGDWWWTIDRSLLAALAILVLAGLVFLMAGGPPVAERLGLSTFHFVNRQVMFLMPALAILLSVSFLSLRHLRRLALAVYFMGMILILLAFQYGPEIKGAHRWMMLGPLGIQPSEFVKPAFVVLAAWAFSEGGRRKDMPGALLGFLILPATIIPLILQPDFGQTMLVTIVWCGLFFIAGLHWFWVLGLGGAGLVGIVAAYEFLPHVRARFERFLDKSSGDTFQVDTAMESFSRGGWLGRGPGEGTVKRNPSRCSHRLHFCGDGGRIRHRCLHDLAAALCLHRSARIVARAPKRRYVLSPCGNRYRFHVRFAGLH